MNRRKFILAGLCACTAPAALAQTFSAGGRTYESRQAFNQLGLRCGTAIPSVFDQGRGDRAIASLRTRSIAIEQAVSVPVRFHVIHDGQKGRLKTKQIDDQIKVLNNAFMASRFEFGVADLKYHDKPEWYSLGRKSKQEKDMKSQLGTDPELNLNVYSVEPKGNLLGWATFPWELEFFPEADGVVITNTSLPGSPDGPFNLGMTAVHEVGHWLGLFHTFQGGCEAPGDSIADTTPERFPAVGCIKGVSSCGITGGSDPVENYMDYSDDACMTTFSSGQSRRMREMTGIFRTALFQASAARAFGPSERVSAATLKEIRDASY